METMTAKEFANLAREVLSLEVELKTGPFGESKCLEVNLLANGEIFNTVYVDLPECK